MTYEEIAGSGTVRVTSPERVFQSRRRVDPRKVERGTSYEAKGSAATPAEAFKESGSSLPPKIADIVPILASRQQELRKYDEMSRSDPTVDVALRVAKIPILGAKFFMQPFDDKPENLEISEFVSYNLLEGMSYPFSIILEDVLRMFDDGYSILEPVFERREWAPRRTGANRKKYTILRKLAHRPAMTISEIGYDDNGGPTHIVQNAIRKDGTIDEVKIPVSKLVIFSFNKRGTIEGRSLLRTAYKPWFYKEKLYLIDAIQKERNALGIPVMTLPQGYTKEDAAEAWKVVTSLRTNEKMGGVEPPGFVLRFEKPPGELVSIMPSIDHHDSKILLNVLAQFLLLGLQSSGGGGRATSGSHVDMYQKSLKYIANLICDTFNLYLIPKIVGYNFNTDEFPKLRVRNIGEGKDTQMWASALANLFAQGIVTPDIETEQWAREQMDMPYKLGDEQTPVEASRNGKGDVSTASPRSGTGNTNTEAGAEIAD